VSGSSSVAREAVAAGAAKVDKVMDALRILGFMATAGSQRRIGTGRGIYWKFLRDLPGLRNGWIVKA
jgi:hypothetical protein